MKLLSILRKEPLYLSSITLNAALATTTHIWIGALGFAATACVVEGLFRQINRLTD